MNLLSFTWNFPPSVIPSLELPRWYGIMWGLGFYFGYIILKRIHKSEGIPDQWVDKSFIYALVGGVLGARFGHCIFYQPRYYFIEHPEELLMVWKGGLASHGGAIGIIIAVYFLSRKVTHRSMLWSLDRFVVPTALAGCLIRLGNLFNHEIVGKVTDSSLGFKFLRNEIGESQAMNITGSSSAQEAYNKIANDPRFADLLADIPARYPAQLFEAIFYLFIFGVLMFLYWKTNAGKLQGFLFGAFLVMIFGVRFMIEFIKENQEGLDSTLTGLNMGQYLSIPAVLIGLYFMFRNIKGFSKGYPASWD